MRQLSLIKKPDISFGGGLRKGKRKLARPITTKKPMHLILKSVKGFDLMTKANVEKIDAVKRKALKKFDVKILSFVNVSNHLHILLQARTRKDFKSFLRYLTGQIAMQITGAKKGIKKKLWMQLAFTRVVEWGKDLKQLTQYFSKNLLESLDSDVYLYQKFRPH